MFLPTWWSPIPTLPLSSLFKPCQKCRALHMLIKLLCRLLGPGRHVGECGWMWKSHHECASDKSAATLRCCHINMVSGTSRNLYHEELRQICRQKGVKPWSTKVFLIKRLEIIYDGTWASMHSIQFKHPPVPMRLFLILRKPITAVTDHLFWYSWICFSSYFDYEVIKPRADY